MKHILVLPFLLFSVSAPSQATVTLQDQAVATEQATPKTFSEMSLEELKAVNTKTLDREDRKAHKKALKAAKKAEKERLAAERKRLKEKAETEKFWAKQMKRHRDKYDASYNATRVGKKAYDADITALSRGVRAGHHAYAWLWSRLPANGRDEHAILVEVEYRAERRSGDTEPFELRSYHWRRYDRAAFDGGQRADISNYQRLVGTCSEYGCNLTESMEIALTHQQLVEAATKAGAINIKLWSGGGFKEYLNISGPTVQGYVMRIHDRTGLFGEAVDAISASEYLQPKYAD
ncbi:MAG: hypothetical protein EP335_06455 [Alphaproteobacteria bacterium]|nr:MAG: hypothetical protein EP335_06455 [Alphaproteobacteria bacterium]